VIASLLTVLGRVRAPTLLVVGARDRTVLALNRAALEGLAGPARLEVVAGASHLFPEPGTLERVAELATAWFLAHLAGGVASEQATS
jgi:putative phosphoribosyl transferase